MGICSGIAYEYQLYQSISCKYPLSPSGMTGHEGELAH